MDETKKLCSIILLQIGGLLMGADTQFSIYKINQEQFSSIAGMNNYFQDKKIKEIINIMLVDIKQMISKKEESYQDGIKTDGFIGVVYRTVNSQTWDEMITNLMSNMEKKLSFELENTNVSYVLFYSIKDSILMIFLQKLFELIIEKMY